MSKTAAMSEFARERNETGVRVYDAAANGQ
jgi:hypothetical protein